MKSLLFSLPWGRAIRKDILVKTERGVQYQTDVTFKGSGVKYAEAFFKSNGNATELLVRADRSLAVLPNDNFWRDVQKFALKRLKEKSK
jgi:hypothetical protein